ncbi:MAG: stage II sporulation protein P [Bacillota bacterium]
MPLKKKRPKRILTAAQQGNRVRAAFAVALAVCMLVPALYYTLFRPKTLTLTYAFLGVQMPFLYQYTPPMPDQEGSESDKDQEQSSGRITIDRADVDPGVGQGIRIELAGSPESVSNIDLTGSEPRILIYHTHTTEAYNPTSAYPYTASGAWRTTQNDRNIVAVGERLAQILHEKYGFSVIHDITNHEPPKLGTAYSRSVKTMEKYKEQYPSITMFIDVHRDAGKTHEEGGDYVIINGKKIARIMFVVGTGEGATGKGFGEMPDFTANYALAKSVTEQLEKICPGLTRNIRVKTGRYNQHISNQCLLAEVGHNMNTFEEAYAAAEYLAAAIAASAGVALELPETSSEPANALPLLP